MNCTYCHVNETGEHYHHPGCPNDSEYNNKIIWRGEKYEDAPKDADGIFQVGTEYVATKTED